MTQIQDQNGGKYKAQQKYLRTNYVRFSLDLKPDVLEQFRAICKQNGTTPTSETKKFIKSYCENNQ